MGVGPSCRAIGWLPTYYQGYFCLLTNQVLPLYGSSHNKGAGYSCIPLLSPDLWLYGVSYALCLLSSLLQCCGCSLCCVNLSSNLLDCSSACPKFWASATSFIQCIFAMHFGIACLGLCILGQCVWLSRPLIEQLHSGMACLACDWLIYDWCLSKCVYCKPCCDWLPL